jgi:hypothetical protein
MDCFISGARWPNRLPAQCGSKSFSLAINNRAAADAD